MPHNNNQLITRRDFITMSAMSAAALFTGCATDAVTGKRYFMLTSTSQEIALDQQNAPHQFSADYGAIQDDALNNYISTTGFSLSEKSHRHDMPYSFRGINAAYVNAYTFPAGSVAITRGMLLNMNSEAELAAVLGHEIGHVVSRHVGKQMTKGVLLQSGILIAAVIISQEKEEYGDIAAGLGMVASGALLAKYSRDNEYEADSLGLQYAADAGYNPKGCIDLMDTLVRLSENKPNIIEMLFATHPMSSERYKKAVKAVESKYAGMQNRPMNRERYMDHTAAIRKQRALIEALQQGEQSLARNNIDEALSYFRSGLKTEPDDYTGLLLMAKCQIAKKQYNEAERYAAQAKAVYPGEPQAVFIESVCMLHGGKYDLAYAGFEAYDRTLAGNPNIIFFKGYCREKTGRKEEAADFYQKYLLEVNQGENAEHAYRKLVEWGYISAS